ncbi:MAG: recombinase family protein [Bryobacteraceae bacterium]|nr:recombinase family protein [Bryobacteraceae bacterium]
MPDCIPEPRAALYARISTTDQGQTAENQLVPLREFAVRQGWVVVAEFVDEASGARADRPALRALLDAAVRKQFDLLLFWSLDRLSRQGALRTLELLDQLTRCGVAWRSYTEPYLDSAGPFGEAIIALLASLARQERLRIQERVRAGLERARREGRRLGRPRRVFDRLRVIELRRQGESWREVARQLGISTGTARRVWAEWQARRAENLPAGGSGG